MPPCGLMTLSSKLTNCGLGSVAFSFECKCMLIFHFFSISFKINQSLLLQLIYDSDYYEPLKNWVILRGLCVLKLISELNFLNEQMPGVCIYHGGMKA